MCWSKFELKNVSVKKVIESLLTSLFTNSIHQMTKYPLFFPIFRTIIDLFCYCQFPILQTALARVTEIKTPYQPLSPLLSHNTHASGHLQPKTVNRSQIGSFFQMIQYESMAKHIFSSSLSCLVAIIKQGPQGCLLPRSLNRKREVT